MFSLFDWDKEFFRFNCLTGTRTPYSIKHTEDGVTIVHNVVGIDKKDLQIKLVSESDITYLLISGETKNEITNSTYSVNSRFSVNANKIKNIEYEIKDGLAYIYVFYKEPAKVNIEIKEK